jgi:SPP1 family phage portal protein
MFAENKHAEDSTLAEWLYVCGLGMRMVLPGKDEDEPFKIYTLDPRYSFVVHYNGLGENVVMGVKFVLRDNRTPVYSVYTKDQYFEIENDTIKKVEPHMLGEIPIFLYPANTAMLGAFEIALPLLDAINEIESNRLDDIVQYVNSFLALLGGTIDEETAQKLDEYKMLCLPEGVDAKYLSGSMTQSDVQVLVDNLYDAVLTICGIPNRNGGSSTSDTGQAVYLRDGHQMAETHMQSVENEFKRSERRFLKLVLRILRDMVGIDLKLGDIQIKFTRRHYDNLQTKSQVLTTMLNNPKIHPRLAFVHSGLFLDPEEAYVESKAWWEEQEKKEAEEMQKYVDSLGDSDGDTVQGNGQDDSLSE